MFYHVSQKLVIRRASHHASEPKNVYAMFYLRMFETSSFIVHYRSFFRNFRYRTRNFYDVIFMSHTWPLQQQHWDLQHHLLPWPYYQDDFQANFASFPLQKLNYIIYYGVITELGTVATTVRPPEKIRSWIIELTFVLFIHFWILKTIFRFFNHSPSDSWLLFRFFFGLFFFLLFSSYTGILSPSSPWVNYVESVYLETSRYSRSSAGHNKQIWSTWLVLQD